MQDRLRATNKVELAVRAQTLAPGEADIWGPTCSTASVLRIAERRRLVILFST